MTEADWAKCDYPTPMLDHLRGKVSDRGFRLFGAACCRRIWGLLAFEESRAAVEVAERFADGWASEEDRDAAQKAASSVYGPRGSNSPAVMAASHVVMGNHPGRSWWKRAATTAERASFAVPEAAGRYAESYAGAATGYRLAAVPGSSRPRWLAEELLQERAAQAEVLRDIAGNPFRPVALDPALRTPLVVSLAQAAYDDRDLPSGHLDHARLAVLADALEEVGADAWLLGHLRGEGPHFRGCVVVDCCLGLS